MDKIRSLKKIGLTEGEAKIYVSLIGKRSKATEIVRETGIYRINVYDILNRLIEKGLATSIIENNVKIFEITEPKNLLNILEEKKREIEEQEKIVNNLMPALENTNKEEEVEIRVYRGKRGLIRVHENMLKETDPGEEIMIFGAEMRSPEGLGKYYKVHHKKRIGMGIRHRLIANENMRSFFERHPDTIDRPKYISKKYISPVNTYIYGKKVVLVIWPKRIAIEIKNDDIVKSYKNYFEVMWKIAKK